jgi:hypothetical protein
MKATHRLRDQCGFQDFYSSLMTPEFAHFATLAQSKMNSRYPFEETADDSG